MCLITGFVKLLLWVDVSTLYTDSFELFFSFSLEDFDVFLFLFFDGVVVGRDPL